MLNGCYLAAMSGAIPRIALSPSEAEYRATSLVARELLYLRQQLESMGEKQTGPTPIGQDCTACIQMIENPGAHQGRLKHVTLDVHWLKEEYHVEKTISIVKIPTLRMRADLMTKALPLALHAAHTDYIKGQQNLDAANVADQAEERSTKRRRMIGKN
jgi:hypothetical protein